jgi:hypothetical protein
LNTGDQQLPIAFVSFAANSAPIQHESDQKIHTVAELFLSPSAKAKIVSQTVPLLSNAKSFMDMYVVHVKLLKMPPRQNLNKN